MRTRLGVIGTSTFRHRHLDKGNQGRPACSCHQPVPYCKATRQDVAFVFVYPVNYKTEIMGNVLFSVIWLIILIFISIWIAGIAAGFYIILIPFTVCIEPLSGLTDFLLTVIQFPKYCAQCMMDGKGF
ncbi:uncharacterized protein LOC128672720 [Plodia interpunctella]|uniref:uncharacterized protein LOC128672720 n=1 Tax=Plodia interpunctella TaxID=58824 RepID=UPI0023682E28|nr:uncharacterized protein LOC128672720 [Plodia interpunctella]